MVVLKTKNLTHFHIKFAIACGRLGETLCLAGVIFFILKKVLKTEVKPFTKIFMKFMSF